MYPKIKQDFLRAFESGEFKFEKRTGEYSEVCKDVFEWAKSYIEGNLPGFTIEGNYSKETYQKPQLGFELHTYLISDMYSIVEINDIQHYVRELFLTHQDTIDIKDLRISKEGITYKIMCPISLKVEGNELKKVGVV